MRLEAERERVASVPVEAGVFALRYISSASDKPPRVFVEVSPASRADVQVVFIPGKPQGVFDEPKQLALVVAERKGYLQLTVCPLPGGGANARVELEPLQRDVDSPGETRDGRRAQTLPPSERPAMSLVCHVAKRGDLAAPSGKWIGGPDAPAVIEGVLIDGAGEYAACVEYQVLIQGPGRPWSDWVRAGEFAGTRGRGLGLVGLRIRLTAAAPTGARLSGEAVFLGCQLIKERGAELEFTSFAGVDPLVGLRFQFDWDATASPEIAVGEVARADREPLSTGAALKVFKSKRASDRLVGLGG